MAQIKSIEIEEHPYKELSGLTVQLALTNSEIINSGIQKGGIWFLDSKIIIMGTFPPKKEYFGRKGYVHFPSSKNQFWKHIDKVYGSFLYAALNKSEMDSERVKNAKAKITFARNQNIGFVDIFSKIKRKADTVKDDDLETFETVFDNGIMDNLLSHQVNQFFFVYSKARDIFLSEYKKHNFIEPKLIRPYRSGGVLLEVFELCVDGRRIYLCYAPIHGPNAWSEKQKAMKMAFDYAFLDGN